MITASSQPHDDGEQNGENSIPIKTYRALVNKCAKEQIDFQIPNGSARHARILISKLFEVARSEVSIITGALRIKTTNGVEIYGFDEVIEQAQLFLAVDNTTINIIPVYGYVDDGNQNRFIREIVSDHRRRGSIHIVFPPRKESVPVSLDMPSIPHMMISDAAAFRLEQEADAKQDSEKITAIANFGAPKVASHLKSYFDSVFKSFSEIASRNNQDYVT